MTHDAVKTKERAYNMLLEVGEKYKERNGQIKQMFHEYQDTMCECGQTGCLRMYFDYANGQRLSGAIAICEQCGDDEALIDDVLF